MKPSTVNSTMKIIRLTTCNSSIEANMIKHLLENEEINCFLTNENFSTIMPHFSGILDSGVQIMIDEKDSIKALKLLEAQSNTNELTCPECNSKNINFGLGIKKSKKIFFVLLSLFAFTPFKNITNTYYCMDCKTEFKK